MTDSHEPGGGSGNVGTRVSFTSVTGKRSGQLQNPASADEKALLLRHLSPLTPYVRSVVQNKSVPLDVRNWLAGQVGTDTNYK